MKVVNLLLVAGLLGFVSIYVFNHINAWVGIAIPVVGAYFVVRAVILKLTKEEK
jgi:hypothetical protein